MGDLAGWRDASIVLLALEFFLVGLPMLAVGYFAVRYLRGFRHWLAINFPVWQVAAVRGRDYVEQYVGYAAAPFVALAALASAIATVASLVSSPRSRVWRSYRG
ncbi:MAG: hypothetical protein HPY83_09385 [Anaerolineae bacterium]|nr:hypothetical protein [Anaerolineae bacterium]